MTGDEVLLREYAALLARVKIPASIKTNPGTARPKIAGVKIVSAPPRSATLGLELTNLSIDAKRKNLLMMAKTLPVNTTILTSSVIVTVAEQSTWIAHPERLVGIGSFPTLLGGEVIEVAFGATTSTGARSDAGTLITRLGKSPAEVRDTVGMVMPRILCMITNEAYFAMGEDVASSHDIDTAMTLGTNYPSGPVERAGSIGVEQVCAVLTALHRHFGEDRYRTAPQLLAASYARGQ